MSATSQHLDPETLAAFAEGRLDATAQQAAIDHLDGCEACMDDVAMVMPAEVHASEARRFGRPAWMLSLAAALVLAVGLSAIWYRARRSPVDDLVAAAPRSARVVEPRLTGGFAWAAYAGADRAAGDAMGADRMKLIGAAGDLVEKADSDGGADAQHAAGVAMVMVQQPIDAIARLEAALAASKDAKTWSDLAAARYAAASQLGRASLYPMALAAADSALRIDGKLPEALFNRALILERLGLTEEAKRAWQRYLEADPSSPWAAEARARLADLPVSSRSSQFERDRPLLERAAERGDATAVRGYVDAHRDRARAYAEAEYLGRWGAAVERKDAVDAVRWLSIARAIGNALAALSGESLARDAVRAIDEAADSERETIAAAHVAYRRGRIAYSRHQLDGAHRDLLRAAETFEATNDPMALAARYYAAGVRLARNETASARVELERARSESARHPSFMNLGAQVRWELGRAHMLDDDWSGAVPLLSEGAAMFRRAGERASEAFVEAMLARALSAVGRADDAWLAQIRAFAALSAEGETALLATAVDAAMHAELRSGRSEAALALSWLELAIARRGPSPNAVVDALVNHSLLHSLLGNPAEASEAAQQAEASALKTVDPALRGRQLADVAAATGTALAESDPRRAAEALTRAIEFHRKHDLPFALPEPLLVRARCAVRLGDQAAAMRDLEAGMAIVERSRTGVTGRMATGVLDAEHGLFGDAIRLSLDRGDPASAFAFAERSRGPSVPLAELQRRLSGSGVAVLVIIALPGEVITFAVTEHDAAVGRRARSFAKLDALAAASLSEEGTAAASALYEDVIRPVQAVLARAHELVIVPDPRLRSVPFAALYDATTRRHLVDRFAVSIAVSGASLQRDGAPVDAPLLAVLALPSAGATALIALPDVERETGEVTALYRRTDAIPAADATLGSLRKAAASADVLHVAGHTERQPGGGEQALLLTGSSAGAVERVTWKTVMALPGVRAAVVVLAACETLRPAASAATHAPSLGDAFLAAGASDVVGTLTPIGDRDARLLFRALHRHLAQGMRPAAALRAVQREAIAGNPDRGGRQSWRAIALLTRRIPTSKS